MPSRLVSSGMIRPPWSNIGCQKRNFMSSTLSNVANNTVGSFFSSIRFGICRITLMIGVGNIQSLVNMELSTPKFGVWFIYGA